jgi:sec-independent protein translocase protein TatB
MFNIGFGELAVICIVLIIAVGPERLPSMMKTLGKTIRTLRQASRDIRASTGIDELMREDFDLYAPIKNPPRRPAPLPAPPEPAALPAPAEGTIPTTPAANVETEPKTVSREETLEPENREDRPSVVVAPPPQAIGLPSDEPEPAPPPPPAAVTAAEPAAPSGNGAPIASNVGTLPRAPIVQTAPPTPAAPAEPQPEAANTDSEPKQSGA